LTKEINYAKYESDLFFFYRKGANKMKGMSAGIYLPHQPEFNPRYIPVLVVKNIKRRTWFREKAISYLGDKSYLLEKWDPRTIRNYVFEEWFKEQARKYIAMSEILENMNEHQLSEIWLASSSGPNAIEKLINSWHFSYLKYYSTGVAKKLQRKEREEKSTRYKTKYPTFPPDMPKLDALGFPGGMLELWDKPEDQAELVKAGIIQKFVDGRQILWHNILNLESTTREFYCPGTEEFAFTREVVEEIGGTAWDEWDEYKDNKKILHIVPYFARLCTLTSIDHETGENTYKSHFYIIKTLSKTRHDGVPGETEAPILKNVFDLTAERGPNFTYRKHMQGLIIYFTRLVRNGDRRYQEALNYLKKEFSMDIREERFELKPPIIEDSGKTDEELWIDEIKKAGTKPLK
jgi:hypothetical protein